MERIENTIVLAITTDALHSDFVSVIESTHMPKSVRERFFMKVEEVGYHYYEILEPRVALRLIYHELAQVVGKDRMWGLIQKLDRLERYQARKSIRSKTVRILKLLRKDIKQTAQLRIQP